MAIYLQNSVFIHIPKTGGIWVAKALRKFAKVSRDQNKHQAHLTPPLEGKNGFAFIRHPATLLPSLYSQRKKRRWNWDKRNQLEKVCQNEKWKVFVQNVIDNPGVIEDYYDYWLKPYENDNFEVGKQENLAKHLVEILLKFDEPFDSKGILRLSKVKENIAKYKLTCSPEQREALYNTHKGFYERWGYEI